MWVYPRPRLVARSTAHIVVVAVLLFVLPGMVSISSAQTVTVQSGTTTFTGLSTDVSITSVDLTKSFLVFSYTVDDENPSQFQVRGDLTTSTNIHFERVGAVVSRCGSDRHANPAGFRGRAEVLFGPATRQGLMRPGRTFSPFSPFEPY